MEIIVIIRQVPDLVEELEIAEDGKSLDRSYLMYVPNEFDEHALEQAIILKETYGGKVTVIAPAIDDPEEMLYTAIAKGADRAVKLTGIEGEPTANALADAIVKFLEKEKYDLVLVGTMAIDELDGNLGPILSAKLKLPYVGVISSVKPENGKIIVQKEFPGGLMSEFDVTLPAVLAIQAAEKPPRYVPIGKVRETMKSASIEEEDVGVETIPLDVTKLEKPEVGVGAEMITGSTDEVVKKIMQVLEERGVLK